MSYKRGIDYFPFQLDLIQDRKFRRLRMEHGAISVLVYLSLLCMIFRDKGYYLDYNDKTRTDVIWEVMDSLRGKEAPTETTVYKIIEGLSQAELFDPAMFRAGKLTSRRIQIVFYRITALRRIQEFDFSIWLLEEAEMRAISGRSAILELFLKQVKGVNQETNHAISSQNYASLKQRKEKERKEKDRKEEKRASAPKAESSPSQKNVYGRFGHVLLKPKEHQELTNQYGEETVKKAVELLDEYMEMSGKRYQNCALAIRRWGIAAVEERAKGKVASPKPNAFCNFSQESLDYDAVEKAMRRNMKKEEKI